MENDNTRSSVQAGLDRLTRQKTILLKTKKRDGTWVNTPVSIVVDKPRAYFRTYDKAGKSKRLRNFPEVRLAASTFRGKPTGPEMRAQAHLLAGEDADRASRLLVHKYPVLHGLLVPFSHKLMRTKTLHYELCDFREGEVA